MEEIERLLDHEVKGLFPAGAVRRAELRHIEDPGQLAVRVFIPAAEDLAAWAEVHREHMEELRRELSLRLPSAKLLEFTSDAAAAPVISMPDDGSLAAEQLSSREIVIKALALLRENYVFPELAGQVAAAVEARLAAGEYDNLDEITLTELLTSHLQEASGDKHLRVRLGGGPGPGRRGAGRGPGGPDRDRADRDSAEPAGREARRLRMRQIGRLDNFGIHRVERLDGNIGYLDLRRVPMPENAGPAITAAMELVAGTYALIIDLRRNGGGSPHGVALWCSYLIAEQPTSSRTFSGGEDFGYTLQALGRAEVIGEATGGGAHPTRPFPISAAVHIGIPFARSINPVTGTNWQGTGVLPDTPVPADRAHDVAYTKALRHVLDLGDVPPPIADEARDTLTTLTG